MLSTAFYFLLNMSLAAGLLFLVLLAVRRIRRLPRRFVFVFWSVVWLRLVCPFALSSAFSVLRFLGGAVRRVVPLAERQDWTALNFMGAANRYFPINYASEAARRGFELAARVWFIGALVALLAACLLYGAALYRLRGMRHWREDLYFSDVLAVPALVGCFRPRIVLPATVAVDHPEIAHIIAHERAHKRRGDTVWRVLATLIACVHWFSPWVWWMLRVFFRDMELSCDEIALRNSAPAERTEYAAALLRFAQNANVFPAFGGSETRARILSVLHFRPLTALGAALSALFLLALALLCVTNPPL